MSDVVSNRRKRVVYYHCGNRGLIMAVEPTRTQITSASISLTANCSRRQCASRRLICVIGMRAEKREKGKMLCTCISATRAFGEALYVIIKMFTLLRTNSCERCFPSIDQINLYRIWYFVYICSISSCLLLNR